GCNTLSSLEASIFVNGLFAHAAELEDDQFPSATSDITVFPVTFPMAEKFKLSGKRFIEASAIGLEVMNRIGMFTLTSLGITDLPFYGILGATASAAKILDLDEAEITSALGIAIGRAGGALINFGTDAHYLESAFACRDGYLAALLAKKGMTGGQNIEVWLNTLHQNKVDINAVTKDLGSGKWLVHNIWVKKYPCCFLTHRQIDMLMLLAKEHHLQPENVTLVKVDVGPIDGTCDRPNPKDIEDSRFSLQHILAGVLLEQDVTYGTFTQAKIAGSAFKQTRDKIKVVVHKDWPNEFNSGIARIAVTVNDGSVYEMRLEQPLGGSKNPLTRAESVNLFNKYTEGILPKQQANKVADWILDLEDIQDVSRIMTAVTSC
ncbi:MAG: MmgE/PrpD family protein, partial [Desulfitobacteriaceae bacterium]|nr:MmgE/PrpD family protein [Desulfitobacteriaceae bacterium]